MVVCRLGTGIFFLVEALFLSSCGLGLSASSVARVPCQWAGPAMKCGMRHLAVEELLFSSKGGINSVPTPRSVGFSLICVINSSKTWLRLVELLSPHVEPWEHGDILPSKLLPQWDLRFRPQASLRIAPYPQTSIERDLRQRRGEDHNYSEKIIFLITRHSVRVLKWAMRVWLQSAWLGILATSIPLYRPEWSLVIQWMEKASRCPETWCVPLVRVHSSIQVACRDGLWERSQWDFHSGVWGSETGRGEDTTHPFWSQWGLEPGSWKWL